MCKGTKKEMKTRNGWPVCSLLILWVLTSLLLTACAVSGNLDGSGEVGRIDAIPIDAGEPSQNPPAAENEGGFAVNSSYEDIPLDECPNYVFYAGEGQLLLVGEGLTLLDGNALEIMRQNGDLGLDFDLRDFTSCSLTVLEKEYVLLGNWQNFGKVEDLGNGTFGRSSSREPELKLIRIGKDLQVMEAVAMNEIIGNEREVSAFVLAEQGSKLIFAESFHGLYVVDMNTGERSTCIEFYDPLTGKENGGIASVHSVQYVESKGQIYFTGSYYNSERKDFPQTFGQVNMDGSGLSYEKAGVNAYGDLWCFDGFSLIEDMEFREHGIGTAFYYDRSKELHIYPLADEYAGLQPSEEGNYFAVQSVVWSEDGMNMGYMVRIYASESGGLIQEIALPRTEIGENTVLSECVICEDAGRILMFLCDRGTGDNAHIKVVNLSIQ